MGINEIIMYVMVIFMCLGALDKMIGNKFGLGEKFEEGIMAMGSLAMSMVGIIILAPILAKLLSPVVVPLYRALGADPSMFATSLIAIDMGGLSVSKTDGSRSTGRSICWGDSGFNDGSHNCIFDSSCAWHY